MLTHCQQFFNSFSVSSPPVWQRAWGTCRLLNPRRLTRIQRWLQAASHTPRRLSTPFFSVTCMSLPKAALRGTHVVDPTSCQCVPFPRQHTTRSAACSRPSRSVLACPGVFRRSDLPEHRTGYVWRPVVWGEAATWFGERQPRGLGRGSPWFGERQPVVWGEVPRGLGRGATWFGERIIMATSCHRKDCAHETFKKTVKKTTHTPVCEASPQQTLEATP
jgi:hypothetical protein